MINEILFEIREVIPDPFKNYFTFMYTGEEKDLTVFVYNHFGQLMKKEDFFELPTMALRKVNLNGLTEGEYYVKFLQEHKQYTCKIQK